VTDLLATIFVAFNYNNTMLNNYRDISWASIWT